MGNRLTAAGAEFDQTRRYRYRFWRCWNELLPEPKTVMWLMLNPSKANEYIMDATVTRCRNFAKDWGFEAMYVGNVYALRSTQPSGLWRNEEPIGGPRTDEALLEMADDSELIVCGWGANARDERVTQVLQLMDGRDLYCLGVNKPTPRRHSRIPSAKHPLYIASSTPLQRYEPCIPSA